MEKGGYKIVDLHDVNLISGETVKIKGVYDQIGKNNRKVLLITGLTIDDVQFNDVFVETIRTGDDYLFSVWSTMLDNFAMQYDIFVEDNDDVTLRVNTVTGGTSPETGQVYFTVKEETENEEIDG